MVVSDCTVHVVKNVRNGFVLRGSDCTEARFERVFFLASSSIGFVVGGRALVCEGLGVGCGHLI